MNARATLSVSALGLALSLPAVAQVPPGYRIVEVTNNQRDERKPRLNNRGQVVFSSRLGGEIFLYDNGQLIQITNDNVIDGLPALNDHGTLVWSSWIGPPDPSGNPTSEIMIYRNGVVTRLTDNDVHDSSAKINILGHITWKRSYNVQACGGPLRDIFFYDGQRIIQITTDGLPEQVENQAPEIN
ncbi:MAG: hypothetical protein IH986_11115, partial [Planctomycetes bacterium]|nr:hypothetical protein [Planctomycetota bacterium]